MKNISSKHAFKFGDGHIVIHYKGVVSDLYRVQGELPLERYVYEMSKHSAKYGGTATEVYEWARNIERVKDDQRIIMLTRRVLARTDQYGNITNLRRSM